MKDWIWRLFHHQWSDEEIVGFWLTHGHYPRGQIVTAEAVNLWHKEIYRRVSPTPAGESTFGPGLPYPIPDSWK